MKLRLAEYLEQNGISKNEFARLLGVPHGHVRRYFRSGYDPKISMVVRWSKALGCSIEELVSKGPRLKKNAK